MEKARLEVQDAEQRLESTLYIYALKWCDLAGRPRLLENYGAGQKSA